MKTDFFKDCTTEEEIKKLYRVLVFSHHPDVGGDTEAYSSAKCDS